MISKFPMASSHVQTSDALSKEIHATLLGTAYECTELERLDGGSVNYTFIGTPKHRTPATEQHPAIDYLLVKHSTGHLSCNKDFQLEVSRWKYEKHVLHALADFDVPESEDGVKVSTPRLFYANDEACVSVIEFVTSSINLTQALTWDDPPRLTSDHAFAAGVALGTWLRAFHHWSSQPAREELLAFVKQNTAMSELKYRVEYGIILEVLQHFPDVLASHRDILEGVVASVAKDFKEQSGSETTNDWTIIHGDFCLGKSVVPSPLTRRMYLTYMTSILVTEHWHDTPQYMDMYIIDWEYAQYGHRAYDLGHMIADLLEREFFEDSKLARLAAKGSLEGYGSLTDELAYRTIIHAGAHMIGWYTRRPPGAPLPAPLEQVTEFMHRATLMIVKAWQRDKPYFLKSSLAFLFNARSG